MDLTSILYNYILGSGRTPRMPTVEQLADEIQKKPVTVYKYLEDELNLPYQDFILIYRACRRANGIGPIEALRWLVSECDPTLQVIDTKASIPDGNLLDNLLKLGCAQGNLSDAINTALADHKITLDELQTILAAASNQIAEIDGLVEEARHMAESEEKHLRRTA